ncbi:MAG: cysteine-rich small domain-containing protein [Lachnospiraceae bacterium]|nr:cysteine-rich small domain-containing protein [Lachnospiraceae bacterium]
MDPYGYSERYFENRECKYYPCHDLEHVNCLFCYCPMYPYADCPGDHTYIEKESGRIKNCTNCTFPHRAENYETVLRFLSSHMAQNDQKSYRFWGSDHADQKPVGEPYSIIRDPGHLYDILSDLWCAETCAPRMRAQWSEDNKTLGQCSITAFLVQDIFGGEVYGIPLADGSVHCYNVVGNRAFDLTSEQFGEKTLDYSHSSRQFREAHFQKEEKRERYELLKSRLLSKILQPAP